MQPDLKAEAQAFNLRIEERVRAGFVPDIRRAVRCEYFYKSFWRDPQFIELYLGNVIENLKDMLRRHGGERLRVLDACCGAGYISLELARDGHRVTAIDIAQSAIKAAQVWMKSNPFKDRFGSLDYRVMPFLESEGCYDAILFSGSLHHMDNVTEAVGKAHSLLKHNGIILCYEPCHENWRGEDAAQVMLMRQILSLSGLWYEADYPAEKDMDVAVKAVHTEYTEEKDAKEQAQSPHDNASSGEDIRRALDCYFENIEIKDGDAFNYRLLGGLRGPDETVRRMAKFLTEYDRYAVSRGYLKPNYFYYAGRKKGSE